MKRATPVALVFAACWPAAAAAQDPPSIEEVLTAHQADIRRVIESNCASPDANNVVVCGRRRPAIGSDDYRVPYEPEPGARIRLVAGEPPGGVAAMGAGGCLRLCPQPLMVDLVGGDRSIVNAVGRGIRRLLGAD